MIGLDFKLIIGGAIVAGALFLGTQGEKPLINLGGGSSGQSGSGGTGTGVMQDATPPNPQLEQLTKVITDFMGGDTSAGETIKDITDVGTDKQEVKTPAIKKTASDGSLFANTLPTYSQNLESNLAGINEQYGAPLFVKLPLAGDAAMYAVNPTIPNDTRANVQEVARLVAGSSKGDASDMYSAYNPQTGIAGYVYAPQGLNTALGIETKKATTVSGSSATKVTRSSYDLGPVTINKQIATAAFSQPATPSPPPTAVVKKAATINLWATPKYPSIAQMMAMG